MAEGDLYNSIIESFESRETPVSAVFQKLYA